MRSHGEGGPTGGGWTSWGAEGDRIYRKLISVMVSAKLEPGDDDWARRFIVMSQQSAQEMNPEGVWHTAAQFGAEVNRIEALGQDQERAYQGNENLLELGGGPDPTALAAQTEASATATARTVLSRILQLGATMRHAIPSQHHGP